MNDSLLPPQAALDLTRAILARTSGSSCERLQELACDLVDETLDATRSQLAQAHLDGCPGCARLVAALRAAQTALPALAQANPGPWFTQRVLRATVHRPVAARTDLRSLWWKLMHRPRIALEAAYLGAAAGLMGITLPIPAPSIPLRVPAFVQPLGASAQRVKAQVIQVERRSALTVQQGLRPAPASPAAPRPSHWQRGSAWMRAQFQALRGNPPAAPAQGNPTGPPNP
ncbi:zf-HC2 domain-containing protein [Geothrix sp. PMB-07]|uniref:zf-HC2 domain-containing protein n=1 Tax=Geothrix sp. PMB-07 TaxID=3068640 RepID=UPI002741816D|nr:hypothetical protein [Geothrix sp. PMB-07]WLT32709.1 hypothetical protein Q9293_05095 [Geothrix sp. PMB-07]